MSIEKESSGLPEVDIHRRTTKVNFGTALGVSIFLIVEAIVIIWISRQHG